MKVGELKKAIAAFGDECFVEVAVRVYTQVYPVAYLAVEVADKDHHGDCRLTVTFPEGYVVSQRRQRQKGNV